MTLKDSIEMLHRLMNRESPGSNARLRYMAELIAYEQVLAGEALRPDLLYGSAREHYVKAYEDATLKLKLEGR